MRRRSLPPGGQTIWATMADGVRLRCHTWPGHNAARGTIWLLNGRGDFLEKYCESYWSILDWGCTLVVFDWRGQGLSGPGHPDDPHLGHVESMAVLVDDVVAIPGILAAQGLDLPQPWSLIAHSMGGHLAARWLHDQPGRVSRGVLLAPMFDFQTGPVPRWLVRCLVGHAERAGRSARYSPGQGPFDPQGNPALRGRLLTSDAERAGDEYWWARHNSELVRGGVSYGWLRAAMESVRIINAPGYLEAIRTPLLILLPGEEKLVSTSAADRASERLPNARLEHVAKARHELLRERDSVRAAVLDRIHRYLFGMQR